MKLSKLRSLEEAIKLKASLLSQGVNVLSGTNNSDHRYKPSKHGLYSYEMSPISEKSFIPQEIILYANSSLGLRVYSTLRFNSSSS